MTKEVIQAEDGCQHTQAAQTTFREGKNIAGPKAILCKFRAVPPNDGNRHL